MSTIAPSAPARSTTAAQARAIVMAAAATPAAGSARSSATTFAGAPRKAGSMSVRERFATLEERFLPDKAKGVDVKLLFKLSGDDGGTWYVVIKDGKITVKEGDGPDPDATVMASAKDYKKMADGEMNKTVAFLRGKLRIKGDRKYLEQYETWFRQA
ncbi:MAG: SCP2 sterol-binding domain-containing protein [Thermoleophilia bacterium]|nr:SCP2 sterol-binding domain-containing protein [Thermoleophilia bacterium]